MFTPERVEAERRFTDHLRWNRTTMANLYYAFWILFLAGLVESFRLPTLHCIWVVLLYAFRILAGMGTILTFLTQDWALDAIGHREVILYQNSGGALDSKQETFLERTKNCEKYTRRGELATRIIALVFLTLGIALSFAPGATQRF